MTSSRRNRFPGSTRKPGLVRNVTGTRICDKIVQRRLTKWCLIALTSLIRCCPFRCLTQTRVDWVTTHRRHWNVAVFTDDQRHRQTFLHLKFYGISLEERPGSGMTSISSWTLNVCNKMHLRFRFSIILFGIGISLYLSIRGIQLVNF